MLLSIIAAYAKDKDGNQVIGLNNKLPWHYPHDLERFREYTRGRAIIMGRKTFESIGRVLPKRDNIVLTNKLGYKVPGAHVFHNLEDALSFASVRNSEGFIIGGQDLYNQTIDRVDRLYLTSFHLEDIKGDTFFPAFDISKYKVIHLERTSLGNDCFRILERKSMHEAVSASPEAILAYALQEEDEDEEIAQPICGGGYTI